MTNLDGVTDPALDEGVAADEVGSAPGGETETEAYQPETEAGYDYLDIDDDLAQKYVRIRQEGEEVGVPLREVLDGYNSNAVATKRFQEAAQLRAEAEYALRVEQAMRSNPGLAVQILANNAGVSVEEFLGMSPAQRQAATDDNDGDEYVDPLEQRIAQQEQLLLQMQEQQMQRDADMRLAQAVSGLKQQYSISDDQVRAVVGAALEMHVGPEMFPMIYESMAFRMQQQAQAQHTAAQEADANRRRAAAQAVNATVATGNGVAPGGQIEAVDQPIRSPRDAILAAFNEVGMPES